ncbi:MAG: LPP20 family lipoprotein [Betaproteobacteria bacterium]|nr:LPP20 family lipoprotein [Betaproteobacteria bacterium]
MTKIRTALLMSLLAVALGGCLGGGKSTKEAAAPRPDCTFPDSPSEAAPAWVCDAPVEGVSVSAVGMHEKSGAGPQFMKDQAAAAARVTLAQQMKVKVTNMVKQYVETTGAAASETVDKVNTSVSKLITTETIEGSRVFRSVTSSKGSMYVLVGLDPMQTKQKAQEALKTSMRNDQALWQQFKAKQGQDELAAEIANIEAKR